ncbi:STN domain-containing protein, partial [Acinetobacter baumannii]
LPAQPLGTSLRAVADASGTNVIVSSALVDGKIAPALSGRFTPIEAISALLRGSGLRARLAGSSLIVERVPAPQDVSAEADGSDIVVT